MSRLTFALLVICSSALVVGGVDLSARRIEDPLASFGVAAAPGTSADHDAEHSSSSSSSYAHVVASVMHDPIEGEKELSAPSSSTTSSPTSLVKDNDPASALASFGDAGESALQSGASFWGKRRRRRAAAAATNAAKAKVKALSEKALRHRMLALKKQMKAVQARQRTNKKRAIAIALKHGLRKPMSDAVLDRRIRAALKRILSAQGRLKKMRKQTRITSEYKKYCVTKRCKALYLRFRAAQKIYLSKMKLHKAAKLRAKASRKRGRCRGRRRWMCRRRKRRVKTQVRRSAHALSAARREHHARRKRYAAAIAKEKARWNKKTKKVSSRRKRLSIKRAPIKCKPKDYACRRAQSLRRIAIAKMKKASALRRIAKIKRMNAMRAKKSKAKAKAKAKKAKAKAKKAKARKAKRAKVLAKKRAKAKRRLRKAKLRRKRALARKKRAFKKAMAARERKNQAKVARIIRKIFRWKGKIPKSMRSIPPEKLGSVIRFLKKNLGWRPVVGRRGRRPLSALEKRRAVNYYKYYLSFSSGVGPWW